MAYVDLNPVRAGIAEGLEDSAHTSVFARMAKSGKRREALGARLGPILGVLQPPLAMTTADYLQLLDWTGRQLAPGKRGRITGDAPACLRGFDTGSERWAARVRAVDSGYWRAIGSAEQLIALAQRIGQRWLKGLRLAERSGDNSQRENAARKGESIVGDGFSIRRKYSAGSRKQHPYMGQYNQVNCGCPCLLRVLARNREC